MGRLRLKPPRPSRLARARVGSWAGGALVSTGSGLAFGLPAALITAGALVIAYCLLIADVAAPEAGEDDGRPSTW